MIDDSVRGTMHGARYIIQDSYGRLLVAGGSRLCEPSIPEVELRAAWRSLIYIRKELRVEEIFIEGDCYYYRLGPG